MCHCWHPSCNEASMRTNSARRADPARAQPENAPGPFFVDDACISCGACWMIAPALISSHPVHTYAFFECAPERDGELKLAREAQLICPVGAIGDRRNLA